MCIRDRLAIAGFPLMAGFMSKDEILWWAFASERGSTLAWALVVLAAFCTAFYMFRIMWMTFWGDYRGIPEGHGHHAHGGIPERANFEARVEDHGYHAHGLGDGAGHGDHGDHGHGDHDHHDDHHHALPPDEKSVLPWTIKGPLVVLGALSVSYTHLTLPTKA